MMEHMLKQRCSIICSIILCGVPPFPPQKCDRAHIFACMYRCMHVCMHIGMHVCIFVLCMYVYAYMYAGMFVCMFTCMHVCIHACRNADIACIDIACMCNTCNTCTYYTPKRDRGRKKTQKDDGNARTIESKDSHQKQKWFDRVRRWGGCWMTSRKNMYIRMLRVSLVVPASGRRWLVVVAAPPCVVAGSQD